MFGEHDIFLLELDTKIKVKSAGLSCPIPRDSRESQVSAQSQGQKLHTDIFLSGQKYYILKMHKNTTTNLYQKENYQKLDT